jgi:hypothetical protein
MRHARSVWAPLALAAAALVMPPAIARAQSATHAPVALVLDVAGGRIAGVEPYKEIMADSTVTVPAGVRFSFQHYSSCRRFVLTGGTVKFRSDGVEVSGTRATDTRVPCPRKITLKSDGTSAAVVMRSLGPPPSPIASIRPTFVLVGPRAADFKALRLKRGDELVVEQPFTGPAVRWPLNTSPLTAATNYQLELVPIASDRASVVIRVRTLDQPTEDPITLVSAE